jgi:hypothetical protein
LYAWLLPVGAAQKLLGTQTDDFPVQTLRVIRSIAGGRCGTTRAAAALVDSKKMGCARNDYCTRNERYEGVWPCQSLPYY